MKDFSLKINGQNYNVQIDDVNESSTLARVIVNGTAYEVEIDGGKTVAAKKPQVTPVPAAAASAASVTPATAAPTSGYSVKSPLPGTVLSIKVAVGDKVAAGQTLLILEAMKMENNIDAERGGVVKQILAQPNATVMEGDTLIVIE
jgi:biotin carboxyl carrier protein